MGAGMILVMVGHSAVAAFNWGATCGGIGGFPGGRGGLFTDNVGWRTAVQQQRQRHHLIVSSQFPSTVLLAATKHDREDNTDSDEYDDVVLDENWSKRFTNPAVARAAASPSAETSQLNDPPASAVVETGSSAPEPALEGIYPLIETWLQSYIPTLSPSDSQTYASILANDGFTTREKLNSINSKTSGRVEDLYFMEKGHRRRLMVELGVVRSRRRSGRAVATDTTSGRTSVRPTRLANNTNKKSSQEMSPLDDSIPMWLSEQSRLANTTAASLAAQGDAQFAETTRKSAMLSAMDDAASKQYRWEGDNDSSSFEASEGEGSIQDDLSARFSSLNDRTMDSGSVRDETQRLRESRKEFHRSESPLVAATMENEIFLDDLTARYSSLEIKPLDDGSSEKENRRLRELKETFQRRVNKNEDEDSSSEFKTSAPDDFVTRYDSLDTTVAWDKVGSAKKEARRLKELKRAYLSTRKKQFNAETVIEEGEPLRLYLLKRPTMQETTIEQKERMRMKDIQRLARLAAEQKVDMGFQRLPPQQAQYFRKDESGRASAVEKYLTNGERRLEALRKHLVKNKRRNADQSAPPAGTSLEHRPPHHRVSEQAIECDNDDEECWDITRSPNFYARQSQSLASTLLPIEMQMKAANIGTGHDAAKEAADTESPTKEDADQVNSGMLPKVFKQESSTMTLPKAASIQCPPLDSPHEISKSSNASSLPEYFESSKTISSRKVLESLGEAEEGEFTQEEVLDVSSSHTNSEYVQAEQDVVVDNTADESIESAQKKYKTSIQPRRILSLTTDRWKENRVFAESQFRALSSLSDYDVLLDVSSRFPESRPFMTVQTRRHERFRSNAFIRKEVKMEDSTDPVSFIEQVDSRAAKQAVRNIAHKFSTDRASFLAFPPRKDLRLAPRRRDRSYPNSPSTNVSESATSSQYLDKPRSFFDICTRPLPGLDEMARTKVSRILPVPPASRNPMSRIEWSSSTVKDAGEVDLRSHKASTSSTSINIDANNYSGEEQVMHWLLAHLPNLQEEEAITYFNSLLNDGFDCNESLREILAEDLHFMTIEHQEALTHILQKMNEVSE